MKITIKRIIDHTIILFACTFATIPYILIILSSFNTSVDIKKGDIFTNFNFTNFRTNFINLTADGNFVTSLINSTEILRQYFINHPQSIDKYTFLQNSAFTHWVKEKCSKMC